MLVFKKACSAKMLKDSENQTQVAGVFHTLWNGMYSRQHSNISNSEFGLGNDSIKLLNWSDSHLPSWVSSLDGNFSQLNILDLGCGGGYGACDFLNICKESFGFVDHINYHGVDLFDLANTKKRVSSFLSELLPLASHSCEVFTQDMNLFESNEVKYNLILALGSLHHTPSVENSLKKTFKLLDPRGIYIGWIVNKQKPLRDLTDSFFRKHFQNLQDQRKLESELHQLALLFLALGESLGDAKVTLTDSISSLELEPGEYNLQTLLYDYIVKCYYKGGPMSDSIDRVKTQLFDWFLPRYYHQTSTEDLLNLFRSIPEASSYQLITKTNGHFFLLKKGEC